MQFIFATAKLPASKKSKSKRMFCAMVDGNSLFVNINLFVSIKTKFLSHLENYICQSTESILCLPSTSWPPTPLFLQYTLDLPLKLWNFLNRLCKFAARNWQQVWRPSSVPSALSLRAAASICAHPEHKHGSTRILCMNWQTSEFQDRINFIQR